MLELAQFPVHRAEFGPQTHYADGRLTIDRDGLRTLLEADSRISRVDIHLAHPGESVRIIHVIDVVEPRVKVSGGQDYFPGLLTDLYTAGQGRTHTMPGMAVVLTATLRAAQEGLIDMSGRAAEVGKFGSTVNLVLEPQPAAGVEEDEYVKAILVMKLKAAVYLAKATIGLDPTEVEVFDLPPVSRLGDSTLPRVAYIYYLQSRGFGRERLLYGLSTHGTMPTPVQPEELLDGALVYNGHTSPSKSVTYNHMNNAVVRALHARHGKDLLFAGVIAATHHSELEWKEHTALLAARMAKRILGADAVVITKDGGGQADVDLMLCCTRCGEEGLPTVLIAKEEAGGDGSFPLIATSPYADAIASMGNGAERFTGKKLDRVLGGDLFYDKQDPSADQLELTYNVVVGFADTQGGVRVKSGQF